MKVTFDLDIEPRVYPFDYPRKLARAFYNRAPSYDRHDDLSLHSIGWIRGHADATSRGLVFSESSTWSLGVVAKDILEEFLASVDDDPVLLPGMKITSARPVEPPSGRTRYFAESPILARRRDEHLRFDEPEADATLTTSLRKKLEAIGIPESVREQVSVAFDTEYDGARTKLVQFGDAKFKANVCPVYIDAPDPLLHEMAMSAGIGALTGMGLGAILPT
jgi:hypothetical protein